MLTEDEHKYPKTIDEYKELFNKIGIDCVNLNKKRDFRLKYDEYLKEKEEDTDDLSDDELTEDQSNFTELQFEEVDYLEGDDEKIYNAKYVHVGSWNDDCDDIVWISDEFRTHHEIARS